MILLLHYILIQKFLSQNVLSHIIHPSSIILEPYSCVNISLTPTTNISSISIKLHSGNNHYIATFYPVEHPLPPNNYFFFQYVHDFGINWICLCKVDYHLEGYRIAFLYRKGSEKFESVSSIIRLASCKYTQPCQNIKYLKEYKLQIFDITQLGEKRLSNCVHFLRDKYVFMIALCSVYDECTYSRYSQYSLRVMENENVIIYSKINNTLYMNLVNHFLSDHSINFIYTFENLFRVYSIKFQLTSKLVTSEIRGNRILLFYKKTDILLNYAVYFLLENFQSFNYYSINIKKAPKTTSDGFISVHNSSILTINPGSSKYCIFFLEFSFMDIQYIYHYTKYFFLDFTNLTIVNEKEIDEKEIDESFANFNVAVKYKSITITIVLIGVCLTIGAFIIAIGALHLKNNMKLGLFMKVSRWE